MSVHSAHGLSKEVNKCAPEFVRKNFTDTDRKINKCKILLIWSVKMGGIDIGLSFMTHAECWQRCCHKEWERGCEQIERYSGYY